MKIEQGQKLAAYIVTETGAYIDTLGEIGDRFVLGGQHLTARTLTAANIRYDIATLNKGLAAEGAQVEIAPSHKIYQIHDAALRPKVAGVIRAAELAALSPPVSG